MTSTKFDIDPTIPDAVVDLYAERWDKIDDKAAALKILENMYTGDKSKEYYEGLLAGYINACSALSQSETGGEEIGVLVAFVASKVADLRRNV